MQSNLITTVAREYAKTYNPTSMTQIRVWAEYSAKSLRNSRNNELDDNRRFMLASDAEAFEALAKAIDRIMGRP